jgi:hypothetical protein
MDRLDRLMAELDGAVERLDARTEQPAVALPEPTTPGQAPGLDAPRARWYWTVAASAAPPPPGKLTEATAQP